MTEKGMATTKVFAIAGLDIEAIGTNLYSVLVRA